MDLAHFSRYLFVEVLRQEVCSCSVGFRPTLIAGHQISDFGVGFQPLLPLVVAPGQESEFPPASGGVQEFSDLTGKVRWILGAIAVIGI